MTKEEAINKLAHIIFDAAKGGYIPFNIDGEHCAMSVARAKINEFLSPSSDTTELLILNLDDSAKVDLEKEIKDYFDSQPIITRSKGLDYRLIPTGVDIAKHFYELGLKAKGE